MKLRKRSLRNTFMVTISMLVMFCIVVIAVGSYQILKSLEENRLQESIRFDIHQISKQMWQEYINLVHVSQQMMPEGYIGKEVENYLAAENRYERSKASQEIYTNIATITYFNPNLNLALYTLDDEAAGPKYFVTNMSTKDTLAPSSFPVLSAKSEITYQAQHSALSYVTNRQVISIMRDVEFSDNIPRKIYLETLSDISASIRQMSESQDMTYNFMQADQNGIICYSDGDNGNQPGEQIDLEAVFGDGDIGKLGEWLCVRDVTEVGFSNILLVPLKEYNRETIRWQIYMVGIILISIIMIYIISYTLQKWIYHPIKIMESEMKDLGQGNMEQEEHHFSIEELDNLFVQFNNMKGEIAKLMQDVTQKESEKHQLEIDKLYYQINPHFLMNALNSAHWMAAMQNQNDIAVYLKQLNMILGYTLGKTDQNTTVRTELQVTQAYLKLQQFRQDFTYSVDVEPGDYLECSCARMILQPVVENSISHNLGDFGNIWISVGLKGSRRVAIEVRDDGKGFDTSVLRFDEKESVVGENLPRRGIGLRYVWLTLEAFYGEEAVMKVSSAPGEGTTVRLEFPVVL